MSTETKKPNHDVREDLATILLVVFGLFGTATIIAANIYENFDGFLTIISMGATWMGVGIGYYVMKVKNWS